MSQHVVEFRSARLDDEDLKLDGSAFLIINDDGQTLEWRVQLLSLDTLVMSKMLAERGEHQVVLSQPLNGPTGGRCSGAVIIAAVNVDDGRVVLQGTGPYHLGD